jgi:hypothetical protein
MIVLLELFSGFERISAAFIAALDDFGSIRLRPRSRVDSYPSFDRPWTLPRVDTVTLNVRELEAGDAVSEFVIVLVMAIY